MNLDYYNIIISLFQGFIVLSLIYLILYYSVNRTFKTKEIEIETEQEKEFKKRLQEFQENEKNYITIKGVRVNKKNL